MKLTREQIFERRALRKEERKRRRAEHQRRQAQQARVREASPDLAVRDIFGERSSPVRHREPPRVKRRSGRDSR